jgi:hypothetical protein
MLAHDSKPSMLLQQPGQAIPVVSASRIVSPRRLGWFKPTIQLNLEGKMIPVRFAVEYPERCLRLLEELEPSAQKSTDVS